MKKYITRLHSAQVEALYASTFTKTPRDENWLIVATVDMPSAAIKTAGSPELDIHMDACKADGVKVFRMNSAGGPLYVDTGSITVFYKGIDATYDAMAALYLGAMQRLHIPAERQNNDIIVDGKKIAGIGQIFSNDFSAIGSMGNITTQPEVFGKYLKPSADKLIRHGEDYASVRVGRLADSADVTPEQFADALVAAFGDAEERPYSFMTQNSEFQKTLAIFQSREWIYYGLKPEEVYKVQDITFHDGKTILVNEVQGNTVAGREVLTFILPEQSDVTFDELKAIFGDENATSVITVSYRDQTGEQAEAVRKNAQTGFVIPVSLAFENGHYVMTLGKRTQSESAYNELLQRLSKLEQAAKV